MWPEDIVYVLAYSSTERLVPNLVASYRGLSGLDIAHTLFLSQLGGPTPARPSVTYKFFRVVLDTHLHFLRLRYIGQTGLHIHFLSSSTFLYGKGREPPNHESKSLRTPQKYKFSTYYTPPVLKVQTPDLEKAVNLFYVQ